MPYDISWYLEKRIIFVEFEGDMDIEALPSMYEDLERFRDEGHDPVHIVGDVTHLGKFPFSIPAIREVAPVMEDFGVCAIYGVQQPLLQFVLKVMSQLSKLEIRIVENQESALASISRLDPTL